ncbi:copper amine oxidase N-terminal domain-containing protein [Paenibacillus sp. 1001270B_150601_E10]|uniref:copper amine oxidase N-terminal domain-containing protein n=1 Tax=Paenibacillus sp. 1001270B_150601_E10 TaxID=2787079 RepID=UPI001E47FBC4|nr:copper amine oxidase N-terminal domain-containing protein [Paenibacillus sp. 1001270B_150601_E10]
MKRKRKLMLIGTGMVIVLLFLIFALTSSKPYQLVINSKYVNTDVLVKNGLTLVPLDSLADLNLQFDWDPFLKKATVVKPDSSKKLILKVGSKVSTFGTEQIILDAPIEIIHGRLVVPIRLISEAFNADVNWIDKTIVIRSADRSRDYQTLYYSSDLAAARKMAVSLPPSEELTLQNSAELSNYRLIFPEGEALRYYESFGNHIWYYEIKNDVKHLVWESAERSTGEKVENGTRPAKESSEVYFELAGEPDVVEYGRMKEYDSYRLHEALGEDGDVIAGMIHAIPNEVRTDIAERAQH